MRTDSRLELTGSWYSWTVIEWLAKSEDKGRRTFQNHNNRFALTKHATEILEILKTQYN